MYFPFIFMFKIHSFMSHAAWHLAEAITPIPINERIGPCFDHDIAEPSLVYQLRYLYTSHNFDCILLFTF